MVQDRPHHLRKYPDSHHCRCLLRLHLSMRTSQCFVGAFPHCTLHKLWSLRIDNGRHQHCYGFGHSEPPFARGMATENLEIEEIVD